MTNQTSLKDNMAGGHHPATVASMGGTSSSRSVASADDTATQTVEELTETVKQLSEIVTRRAERAGLQAQATVREYPWTAMAAAAATGAIVALAIAPRRKQRSAVRDWQNYLPSSQMVQPFVPTQLPSAKSLSGRFEGLLDTISELDPKAISVPALKSAQELYGTVREAIRSFSR